MFSIKQPCDAIEFDQSIDDRFSSSSGNCLSKTYFNTAIFVSIFSITSVCLVSDTFRKPIDVVDIFGGGRDFPYGCEDVDEKLLILRVLHLREPDIPLFQKDSLIIRAVGPRW